MATSPLRTDLGMVPVDPSYIWSNSVPFTSADTGKKIRILGGTGFQFGVYTLGTFQASFNTPVGSRPIIQCNRVPTAAGYTVDNSNYGAGLSDGAYPATGKAINFVMPGNSYVAGQGATVGQGLYEIAHLGLIHKANCYSFGVAGQKTTEMAALAATQVDPLFDATKQFNICAPVEITNDLAGKTPQQAYDNYANYCLARRALGWLVIPVTCITDPTGAINTLIRANWRSFGHALCDVAADPRWGDGTFTSPWLADGLHPNTAGHAIFGNYILTTVQQVLSAGGNRNRVVYG